MQAQLTTRAPPSCIGDVAPPEHFKFERCVRGAMTTALGRGYQLHMMSASPYCVMHRTVDMGPFTSIIAFPCTQACLCHIIICMGTNRYPVRLAETKNAFYLDQQLLLATSPQGASRPQLRHYVVPAAAL